ncbi:hypothetical protein POTOM_006708 [Populus tomentosa]|uniref:RRM domain-containing protein n=1 Tax=Populus tomentosa TaxID=118781 RepID=A0A8X8DFC3_POPTO|nr:hypothetical protein POTOM_006708 [Populus tomentosa]
MAMRATMSLAAAATAPRGGLLRLFSTTSTLSSSFPFPQTTQQTPAREQAEPNTNLFVSGKCLFLYISYRRLVEEIKRAFAEEDVCGVDDEESYEVYSGSGTIHPYYVLFDASIILVSGLSKRTTTEGLQEAFSKFGEVVHAKVVTDRTSGYSKGFGFVRYGTLEDAAEGIKGMDGQVTRHIVWIEAKVLRPYACSVHAFVPCCSPGNQGYQLPYGNGNIPHYLTNLFLDGWVIFAEYARPKQPPSQPQNNMGPGYGNYTNPNHRWQ